MCLFCERKRKVYPSISMRHKKNLVYSHILREYSGISHGGYTTEVGSSQAKMPGRLKAEQGTTAGK